MLSNYRLHRKQVIGYPNGGHAGRIPVPKLASGILCPDVKADSRKAPDALGSFAAVPCGGQSLTQLTKGAHSCGLAPKPGEQRSCTMIRVCLFPMEMEMEASFHPALQGMKALPRAEQPFVPSQYSSPQWQSCLKMLAGVIVPLRT